MIAWVSRRNVQAFIYTILCVAAAFAMRVEYLHRGFFEDDYGFISRGPIDLSHVATAFNPITIGWFYRPVFLVWIDIFNTIAPHSSVVLHTASLVLFGLTVPLAGSLAYRLTKNVYVGGAATLLFLFAHGMEEAIWWISSGSTLLAALFSMITLHLWLTWREGGRRRYAILAMLTMCLALCSKEDAASLPFILIVLDWYLIKRNGTQKPLPLLWPTGAVIVALAGLYGILDLTAYHHVNSLTHNSTTNLWHGFNNHQLRIAAGRGAQTLVFNHFGYPANVILDPYLCFILPISYLFIRARRIRLVLVWAVIALLAFLPCPVASGQHAQSSRFAYVPNLYGSILASLILYYALTSKRRLVNITAITMAYGTLSAHFSLHSIDMSLCWMMYAVIPVACYLLWRSIPDTKNMCTLIAVLSIASLVIQVNCQSELLLIVGGAIGAIGGYVIGREVLMGVLLSIMMSAGDPVAIVITLLATWAYAITDRPIAELVKTQEESENKPGIVCTKA